MVAKLCFKCKKEKDLSEFYTHKQMKDGHLNKCIECTKKDVRKREVINLQNEEWAEKEKNRHRKKSMKARENGYQQSPSEKKVSMSKYRNKYPEKYEAKKKSQHIKKESEHKHHWSYNEEHFKDVIHLTSNDHFKLHRYIKYDQERRMYRHYKTNILLDSKEQHLQLLEELKKVPF